MHLVEGQLGGLADELLELAWCPAGPGTARGCGLCPGARSVDSAVPRALTRRLTVSIDDASGVGDALLQTLLGRLDDDRAGVRPVVTSRSLPAAEHGVADRLRSLRSSFNAASHSSGLASFTCSWLPCTPSPVKPIFASRNDLRASSRRLSNQSLLDLFLIHGQQQMRAAPQVETERHLLLGMNDGQPCTCSLEKKFGKANSTPARHVSTIRDDLEAREMQHRDDFLSLKREQGARSHARLLDQRGVLDRLALGAHVAAACS